MILEPIKSFVHMACLITILTILIYILQSTDCHIVRDIGQHTENFFRSLSFNLEDDAHNQESIDKPININFQDFLNSLPSEVDDGSSIASALNDQHGLRLTRSSNQDFLKSLTNEVDGRNSIASALNDQHGLRLARSSTSKITSKITKGLTKGLLKRLLKSDGLECYVSAKNHTQNHTQNHTLDESHLAESKYWKTCTSITTTLYDKFRKLTTVVYGGIPQEHNTGCSIIVLGDAIADGDGEVIKTCYCNKDGCNPATNQAMFSSILLMTLPAVILVTPMVHARFI